MTDYEARFGTEPLLTYSQMEWGRFMITFAGHAKRQGRHLAMAPAWLARLALRVQAEEKSIAWQKIQITSQRLRERAREEALLNQPSQT